MPRPLLREAAVAISCFHRPIGRCRSWEEALAAEHDKVGVIASSAAAGTHPLELIGS